MSSTSAWSKIASEPPRGVRAARPERRRTFLPDDLRPWLILAAVVFLILGWMAPVRLIYERTVFPLRPAESRTEYEFAALVYDGREANGVVALHNLEDHLRALKAQGFAPVSLADIQALYAAGLPLPPKAVLLTFDHLPRARASSVKWVLRRQRWNAALFHAPDGDPGWRTIRQWAPSAYWDIGIQHGADSTYAQLYVPRSDTDAGSSETAHEFRDRVMEGHRRALRLFEQRADVQPTAFVWPGSDDLPDLYASEYAQQLVHAMLSRQYKLGFRPGDDLAYNSRDGDPLRLNRLLIQPEWSGEDLVERLERPGVHAFTQVDGQARSRPIRWMVEQGRAVRDAGRIEWTSSGDRASVLAWVSGSEMRSDMRARLSVAWPAGTLDVYLRAEPYRKSWFRLSFAGDGRVVLQSRDAWQEPVTLATGTAEYGPEADRQIEIILRGALLHVSVDERPVFDPVVFLPGPSRAGRIGLAIRPDTDEQSARLALSRALVTDPPATLVMWQFGREHLPYVTQLLEQESYRMAHLSPPWYSVTAGEEDPGEQELARSLYGKLARIYNLDLVPHLEIRNEVDFARWRPVALAQESARIGCGGLFLDMSRYPRAAQAEIMHGLADWARSLQMYGQALFVRLPRFIENISAMQQMVAVIPGLQIVVGQGIAEEDHAEGVRLVRQKYVAEPRLEEDIQLFYEILSDPAADAAHERDSRIQRHEQDARDAIARGAHEEALVAFSGWHEMDPDNPEPLTWIGHMLIELDFRDEAVDFYRQSLELAPEQIDVATRLIRLLDQLGRSEESRQMANTYALLFPDHPDILIAQAEWLYRHQRRREARDLVDRIRAQAPASLDAASLLARLATSREDQRIVLDILRRQADDPARQDTVARLIMDHDLISWPHGSAFADLVRHSDIDVPAVGYVRNTPITEDLRGRALSDAWRVDGLRETVMDEQVTLHADPERQEFTAKLTGSERWYDTRIAATVTGAEGSFWLMARRSGRHAVRFGFDEQTGRLHLQALDWSDEDGLRVRAEKFAEFQRPATPFRMRLNVQGDRATGWIGDRKMFDAALIIPPDIRLGGAGFSAFDPAPGRAFVSLAEMEAAPLPMRCLWLDASFAQRNPEADIALIRERLEQYSDVCPPWFTVQPDAGWTSQAPQDDLVRMFARYHGVRFMPVVRVLEGARISAADILAAAELHRLNGMIVAFDAPPAPEVMNETGDLLADAALAVYALHAGTADHDGWIAGWGRGALAFGGSSEPQPLGVTTLDLLPTYLELSPNDHLIIRVPPRDAAPQS